MTELGNDALLADAGAYDPDAGADADADALSDEQSRVSAITPLDDPVKQYPDPDETPDGDAEEWDPMPPEVAA